MLAKRLEQPEITASCQLSRHEPGNSSWNRNNKGLHSPVETSDQTVKIQDRILQRSRRRQQLERASRRRSPELLNASALFRPQMMRFFKNSQIPGNFRHLVSPFDRKVTHKRIICVKCLKEGKTVEVTARETNHSPEAVTRYINDSKRVYACLSSGWEIDKISYATGLSKSLTQEYINLINQEGR